MRETSETLAALLTQSRQVHAELAVYYDGEPLLDVVPITDGGVGYDSGQTVPGTLDVSIPRYVTLEDGRTLDLLPTSAGSPINAEGTQLAVTYYVARPGLAPEALALGWFRIEEWEEESPATIGIKAASLEALIAEARLIWTSVTSRGVLFSDAAAKYVGRLLPLEVTANPERKLGRRWVEEEDRLGALIRLVNAWPARMFVDDSGTLVIAPPLDDATDPVVAHLTDGEAGTVVHVPTSGARGQVYNAVKASGEAGAGDVAPVAAVVYLKTGPRRWNGPYGNVPYFYASPLLTTKAECIAAAQTRLERLQTYAEPVTIDAAPDPRFEVGDLIGVTWRGRERLVRIDTLSLPLTADGGTMQLTGHEVIR